MFSWVFIKNYYFKILIFYLFMKSTSYLIFVTSIVI